MPSTESVILKSCDLKQVHNEIVTIKGTYYQCMEYSGFNTEKKDSCMKQFDMNLNFDSIEIPDNLQSKFDEIQGCTAIIDLTIKGILMKDSESTYGHLGSNNAELIVLEVLNIGELKYITP